MKLANALSERKDIQRRINQLSVRLNNNARVQEGENPAENPIELLEELDRCLNRLEMLISAINRTNNTPDENGVAITDLLAKRECMEKRIDVIRQFLAEASAVTVRRASSEIKQFSTVNVREQQKALDVYSKALREFDEKIQEKNWTTEIDI